MRNTNFVKKYIEDNLKGLWLGRLDVAVWRSLESKFLMQASKRVGINENMYILDIGCGDGYFTNNIFDREKIIGIDILEDDLKTASQYSIFTKLVCEDVTKKIPFEDNYFDFAFSNCVFEHIPDPNAGLAQISRTLKPGAWLFLSVPSECFGWNTAVARMLRPILPQWSSSFVNSLNKKYDHLNLLTPSLWKDMLRRQGFDKVLMLKYLNHKDYLIWDFFRQYFPNKVLRIMKKIFGTTIPTNLVASVVERIHSHYDVGDLGEVTDDRSHNGLIILCQKHRKL
jgi:SAM-dependent methyltransferase